MFTTLLLEKVLSESGVNRKFIPEIINGASIDSRKCGPGSLFFAFKGENTDGHEYIPALLEKGVWCVGSGSNYSGERYINVPDVLEFMSNLAHERRKSFRGKVLAITGSSGKTSTRELIVSMLGLMGKTVHATTGNLNNHLGLPLVILNLPLNTDYLVLEMGMNHSGEIRHLVKIADPDYTLITNIGTAHIGNFASHAELAKAKLEIFEFSESIVVANLSDKYMRKWAEENSNIRKIYGYHIEKAEELSNLFHEVPEYMLDNMYSSSKIVEAAEGTHPDFAKSLENCELPKLRGETKIFGRRKFIVDCYNANPESMKKSVENFYKKYGNENDDIYLILGSMFELGEFSKKMHGELVNYLKTLNLLKRVFLVGCEFEKIRLEYLNEKKVLFLGDISEISSCLPEEGIFLLKGSRGNKLERIFELFGNGGQI